MDQNVLQENYNTTGNDLLQFVLSKSYEGPYFVICLIWTMPKTYHLSSDLNYEVSCCLVPNTFLVLMFPGICNISLEIYPFFSSL